MDFPARHLISLNIANGRKKVERPHPAVSIFNFDTFTTAIYKAWFGFFSLPAAAQLSSFLVIIVFVLIFLLFLVLYVML